MNNIIIRNSRRYNKKYDVFYNGKWIPFGQKGYLHFRTSELIPKELNRYPIHNDLKRRERYLKRAMGIRDKNGNLTYNNPNSANFWAINLLW